MSKPSQVILLLEDSRHEQFISRYLRNLDLKTHDMRIVKSPSGSGSAEAWVRDRFAIEVEARRRRQAETKLIVIIDADAHTVQEIISQLDEALREAGVTQVHKDEKESIVRLVPKRNIETWILCLNGEIVNEDTDYKRNHADWTELIRTAAGTLRVWTRRNAALPQSCIGSLRAGVLELQKVRLWLP